MNVRMVRSPVLLGFAFAATAASAQQASPVMPDWMAGAWVAQTPAGDWTEEFWTPAKGGLMLGAGRSGKGEAVQWWEQTRIEQKGGAITFCARPKGQEGACFTATSASASEIVFENPKHDFPTRVAYRRDGDRLIAEINGPDGANPQRWTFSRRP